MKQIVTIICALTFVAFLNISENFVLDNRTTSSEPSFSQQQISDAKTEFTFEQQFSERVEHWMTMLADEAQFTAWQHAKWEKHPLGPGTHGWIVMITSVLSDRELGYMVISATPEGNFALVEYGTGQYPLFSMTTRQHAIEYYEFEQDGTAAIDRLYYHPLQAVWYWQGKDTVALLNGVDGEAYYIDQHVIAQEESVIEAMITDLALITSSSRLSDRQRLPSFDPYENMHWLIEAPLTIESFADLKLALERSNRIIHSVALFNNSIRLQVAITGYHAWDDAEPYIMVDQLSARYIPISFLLQHGQFYKG